MRLLGLMSPCTMALVWHSEMTFSVSYATAAAARSEKGPCACTESSAQSLERSVGSKDQA